MTEAIALTLLWLASNLDLVRTYAWMGLLAIVIVCFYIIALYTEDNS